MSPRPEGPDTLGGRYAPAYVIYDRGQVIGTVVASRRRPSFGPAAPTVFLNR